MGSGASFKMDFGGFDRMLDRAVSHFTGKTRDLMEECGEIMPKREFIGISDDTADELKDALGSFMHAGFKP